MIRVAAISILSLTATALFAVGVLTFGRQLPENPWILPDYAWSIGDVDDSRGFTRYGFARGNLWIRRVRPVPKQRKVSTDVDFVIGRRKTTIAVGPYERGLGDKVVSGTAALLTIDARLPYYRCSLIHIELWFPFVLCISYPAVAFIRGPVRRYRRRKRNQCVRCGYDLTENASGVCSECGGPIPLGLVRAGEDQRREMVHTGRSGGERLR